MKIFAMLSLFSESSIQAKYFTNSSIRANLEYFQYQGKNMSFYEINDTEQFWTYLNTSVKKLAVNETKSVFYLTSELAVAFTTYIPRFLTVGQIQLRQVRTSYFPCQRFKSTANANCLHFEYKGNNIEKEALFDRSQDWHVFKSAAENNFSASITGDYSVYDGSGFATYFDFYMGWTEYESKIQSLKAAPFITEQTRAVFYSFTLYYPTNNLFVNIVIPLEISVTGIVKPLPIRTDPFKLSINAIEASFSIVRLSFASAILFFVITQTFGKYLSMKNNFRYPFSLLGMLNVLIFVFTLANFISALILAAYFYSVVKFLMAQYFLDMGTYVTLYNNSVYYLSFLSAICLIRLIYALNLARGFKLFLTAFERVIPIVTKGLVEIIYYFIVFVPILLGLMFVVMMLWGPYISNFSTITKAFTTLPLLLSGGLELDLMLKFHYGWAILFITLIMIIIIFFTFPVFFGITIDNFRIIFKDYGNSFNKSSNWSKIDYILWFLAWLPPKVLRNIAYNQKRKQMLKEK